MNDQHILQELETVLEALGIRIRRETLEGSPGGLCRVNGRPCMFLDTSAPAADLAGLCAETIRSHIDLESVYLKPEVRRFLEQTPAPMCRETNFL